jgi:UPF0716 family protein affecting phage T7 exclusion
MPDIGSVLGGISAVGYVLLAWRLHTAGLARKYRVFSVYVAYAAVWSCVMPFLKQDSAPYFWFWLITQPVSLILYIWVVTELIGLVLARHEGFYTAGRWAMYAGITISAVVSAATLLPKITPEISQGTRILWYCFAAERAVDFSLAIFLLLMVALLNFYAVPLNRNVIVHAVVYTIFFLSNSLWAVLRNVLGLKNSGSVDTVMMAVSCACIMAWLFLLSPAGEEVKVRAPWYDPDQEARILSHLDSLNTALLKIAQK